MDKIFVCKKQALQARFVVGKLRHRQNMSKKCPGKIFLTGHMVISVPWKK